MSQHWVLKYIWSVASKHIMENKCNRKNDRSRIASMEYTFSSAKSKDSSCLPIWHTTLLRRWINVRDVDSTSQQRRVPNECDILCLLGGVTQQLPRVGPPLVWLSQLRHLGWLRQEDTGSSAAGGAGPSPSLHEDRDDAPLPSDLLSSGPPSSADSLLPVSESDFLVGQSAIRWFSALQWWQRLGSGGCGHLAAMWLAYSLQL